MRVLHLVPALFGPAGVVGGAERYAFELARHMADREPTRLVTFGSDAGTQRVGNLEIRILAGAWHVRGQKTNPLSASIVPEVLGADVVHCHQQHVLMSSVAAALCRMTGRRVFATELGGGGWDVSAYVSTDRWFDGHLHISEFSRHVYGHDGQPWARVIMGGVDTERFSPSPDTRRGCTPLFVGRLLPHKGLAELIDTLPPGLPLDIVGPRSDEAFAVTLETRAKGKPVTFHHDLTDAALVDAYRRASCVVLPSVYRAEDGSETKVPELLGQTLLEGMSCGTPVICTRVASMPEVVDDGVTGFIVEPGDRWRLADRLGLFARHPEQADVMGAAGRRRVLERFQWPQVVQRCLEAYGAAGANGSR
jgi:glycosyltransferase involved in cell wall biosynthesis